MWRYDLRGRRHRRRCEKSRTTRRFAVVKINEEIYFSSFLNPSRVKPKSAGIQNVDSVFLYIKNLSRSPEDPIATGTLSAILDFSKYFLAYWRSIREVYSVIDRLHMAGFIQSVFDIIVRGEINYYIASFPWYEYHLIIVSGKYYYLFRLGLECQKLIG